MVCVGRRAGKSVLGMNRCADPAVLTRPVAWFSPTYKMLLEIWREAVRTFAPITARRSVQERRIEFTTGGMLEFWSLDNPDVARGRRYRRVVIDEAAMVPALMDAWQYAIRPTLADYNGDGWFLSTPKGHNGFWQLWQRGQDPAHADWHSWQMPSSVNPLLAQSEIDEMRQALPESAFRQEILAAFLDDGGSVFRGVRQCATATAQPNGVHGHTYIVGADWGRDGDFTAITVLDVTTRELVALDRFNQIDYHIQLGRLRALCDRFRPAAIIAEANSVGAPVIEQMRRMGLPVVPFMTTNASKQVAIDALALAFEQRQLRILPDEVLIGELEAYTMERLPSGLLRYGAPEGQHDDTVMSLALAWSGASKTGTRARTREY